MIRRALMRRGIYTGVYTSWHQRDDHYPPRPLLYFIVNRKGSGMVRIEIGGFGRTFWVDWGPGAEE